MAIAAMMGMLSDPIEWVMRAMGRRTGESPLKYENPAQMISALKNPATEAQAVARMHKMHYGAFYNKKSRGAFSFLAENELKRKGKGLGGAIFGRPVKGLSVGISHFKAGLPFIPISAAIGGFTAPRGHKLSGAIGGAAKAAAYNLGDLVGTAVGGPMLGLAMGLATEKLGGVVEEGVQFLHDFNKNIRHINMGGNYEDSRVAYTMRQRAAQEMGSSVMNARMWLGKEASLMHQ